MATPSDGTFGSFIKSRNGIAVIIIIGLPLLLSMLAAVLIPVIVGVTVDKTTSGGGINTASFRKTDLDDGWIRYEYKENPRFSVELPEDWEVNGFSAEELEEIYDAGLKSNPELNELLSDPSSREIIECCMKMIAYDRGRDNRDFTTNINIIADQIPATTDFEEYVDDQLSFVDSPDLIVRQLRPEQGKGSVAQFEQSVTTPAGRSVPLALTQYYFLNGQDVLIITATTPEADADDYEEIFERIGNSVSWL